MTAGRLTPTEASTLLDHLIGDAAFRASFTADPAAALASLGIDVDHRECLDVEVLASPEELQQVRAELETYLTASVAPMTVVFCFEAGKVGDAIS
ncbi:MAG: NHLP-related RiPP peptide [Stenotrophomonas sp.]